MFVFACIVVGLIVAHHWHEELTAICRDCGHSAHHYLPNHGGVCDLRMRTVPPGRLLTPQRAVPYLSEVRWKLAVRRRPSHPHVVGRVRLNYLARPPTLASPRISPGCITPFHRKSDKTCVVCLCKSEGDVACDFALPPGLVVAQNAAWRKEDKSAVRAPAR